MTRMTLEWQHPEAPAVMQYGEFPKTINVDMDGVIYDMVGEYLRMFAPNTAKTDIRSWNIWEYTGQPKAEFWEAFHSGVRMGLFFNGKPYEGAVEAITHLDKLGHRVRIVTSKTLRSSDSTRLARQDTVNWLDRHGLGHLEVVFTGGYAKQGYPADVIIDDKPTLEWAQYRPHVQNILFTQPWNAAVNTTQLDVDRAANWSAVLEMIGVR